MDQSPPHESKVEEDDWEDYDSQDSYTCSHGNHLGMCNDLCKLCGHSCDMHDLQCDANMCACPEFHDLPPHTYARHEEVA